VIDFHCHLDLFPNPADAVAEADRTGVYALSVTTTPKAFPKTAMLAKGRKRIRTALGLHPELAHERKFELSLFDRLIGETEYVGEVGLDGSKDFTPYFADQEMVFTHILATCKSAGGRIVSVHSRNAATAVLDCLDRHEGYGTAVLHWFSGSSAQLRRAVDMGCWFSVGTQMLRSAKGKKLVADIPRDRILTETDAPFGTRSGGSYPTADVKEAVELLATMWRATPSEIQRHLNGNLRTLLGKA